MGCDNNQFNLGVRNIILGEERMQRFCIRTKADVSGSLNNKYFVVHRPGTQAKFYVWFNVNSLGVDPAVPNATEVEVALATNASASAVATAIAAALGALTWIDCTADLDEVECEMTEEGYAYEARNGFTTNSPKFTITTPTFGGIEQDLGPTNGDITLTIEELMKDVTSPQTGAFILAELRTGVNVGMSFELKDSSQESLRRVFNFYGTTFVSDDSDSKVITGYGSKNLFRDTSDVATKITLRPTNLAENADPSQDFTLPKAKVKLGELTLSAENELVLPCEVVGYLDQTRDSIANFFIYGDASKVPAPTV